MVEGVETEESLVDFSHSNTNTCEPGSGVDSCDKIGERYYDQGEASPESTI